MRTNKMYILREIAEETMLIPTGEAAQRLNGYINLTETGAFIWKQVDVSENLKEIAEKMMEEYEVDEETAMRDVVGFITQLYIREMVYDIPEFEGMNFAETEAADIEAEEIETEEIKETEIKAAEEN